MTDVPQSRSLHPGLLRLGAGVMFLGVSLGAFGAHGLEHILEKYDRVATWDTAVLYHLVHGLTLVLLAVLGPRPLKGPAWCFTLGILLFSGSLYILSLTNVGVWGAVTPFGGVAFLAGWLWLLIKP